MGFQRFVLTVALLTTLAGCGNQLRATLRAADGR
jgi:hypothetical protein